MPADTAIHFFLQLAVILMACRLAGLVARRIGQAQVVGEMIAGVILGPSLLGRIAPDLQGLLFPPGITNVVLYTTAQIGLVLYMFIIGLNFDVNHVKQRAGRPRRSRPPARWPRWRLVASRRYPCWHTAGSSGRRQRRDGDDVPRRLGRDHGLPHAGADHLRKAALWNILGTLALACGATSDAISWCILAVVLAVYRNSPVMAVVAIVGGLVYTLVLLTLGRRAFAKLGDAAEARQAITAPMLSTVLIVLMACAWLTDTIGIYAIFGAFILARPCRRDSSPNVSPGASNR